MKKNISIVTEINQQERIKSLVQNENYRFWLGGFFEGVGVLVVSISKNTKVTPGLALQPEFNVAQHENNINILYSFKYLFDGAGSVHKKSGSDKVWVYSLKGTQNMKNYVIPFIDKYIVEYSSKYRSEKYENYWFFCKMIHMLEAPEKKTLPEEIGLLIELIKAIYWLNPDKKVLCDVQEWFWLHTKHRRLRHRLLRKTKKKNFRRNIGNC